MCGRGIETGQGGWPEAGLRLACRAAPSWWRQPSQRRPPFAPSPPPPPPPRPRPRPRSMPHSNIARVGEDFYPALPASHTAHLANAAFTTLLMGVIAWPDWDM